MRYLIFFLSLFSFFSSGAYAELLHYLTKDQIIMTNSGFFFVLDDISVAASSVSFIGNGVYAAEYYGQCGRCGWALDKKGKCTNQNCNQYGPKQRD